MANLIALDLPGGPQFVDELRRAWDDGDAVLPVDQRLPAAAKIDLIERMRPSTVITGDDRISRHGGEPVEAGDALVVATSGSTGHPKGVVLTHDAVAASAWATSTRLNVGPHDRWLACLPLAHVGGLSVVTRALITGTALDVIAAFDATTVDASSATLVSLVATALQRIDADRWRVIVLGGSRPPISRPTNTVATYGLTETGSGVVYDGVPLDGVEVRIVDGEIWLRAPMLLRAYRDGTDPKTPDGWFATGDLGSFDDGRLVVAGRRGDLIISGGENVWPEPVEAVLNQLAGIADVAVTGVADPEWGQMVTAFVVPAETTAPPSLAELREAVKAQLPAFMAPQHLVVVDAIPRTSLGKVRRHALASPPSD